MGNQTSSLIRCRCAACSHFKVFSATSSFTQEDRFVDKTNPSSLLSCFSQCGFKSKSSETVILCNYINNETNF